MYSYPENLKVFSKFISKQKSGPKKKRAKLEVSPDTLTSEQQKAFRIVEKVIQKENSEQLFLFIHGIGGTGKSRTLTSIRDMVESKFNDQAVLVCGPTGISAHNVSGETLHSTFGINIFGPKEEIEMPTDLKGALSFEEEEMTEKVRKKDTELKTRLKAVRLIIIDEISMVGARLLSMVEEKIRKILCSLLPFGGLHVIISGDIGQLRPIYDRALFVRPLPGDSDSEKGVELYHLFKTVVVLSHVIRQDGEQQNQFRKMLSNLRRGMITDSDIKLLNTRHVSMLDSDEMKDLDNVIHVYPFRNKVSSYNR
jgi:PIF1-like helicase